MMQYNETFQVNNQQFIASSISPHPMNKNQFLNQTRSTWPGFPSPKSSLNSNFGDTNCMEQLLVHCATAIENNDATLAQQILWVLNNLAPQDGDSNQRLTCGFLRALIARAAKSGNKLLTAMVNIHSEDLSLQNHKFTIIELANYVDLTPWHRFGFTAANMAVLEAIEGYSVVHIVDLSLTHCMQIPTLVDSIATRLEGPPLVKLTVVEAIDHDLPPMLDVSYEELGFKLVNFARSRNVAMEFNLVHSSYSNGFSSLIEHLKMNHLVRVENNEALVVNCHMMLHYIPEETLSSLLNIDPNNISTSSTAPPLLVQDSNIIGVSSCLRTMFLKELRSLDPTLVILVDEDADFTSNNLVNRLRSAYNYLWIPYDTIDTFVPRGKSRQRQWYEADISWKIENVISHEGHQRIERLEPKCRWVQRMSNAGFRGVPFNDDAAAEVKSMLDEHAAGWGLKKEDDDLVLTWKGHNVVFASSWLPC